MGHGTRVPWLTYLEGGEPGAPGFDPPDVGNAW